MTTAELRFWGKTFEESDRLDGNLAPMKPILHHMIDVAAVAASYLRQNRRRLAREATLLQVPDEPYVRVLAFLAGLHDLGKYTRAFQAKRPDLWPYEILGPCPGNPLDLPHWRATSLLLRARDVAPLWTSVFPQLDPDDLSPIVAAVSGHHGRPPKSEEIAARPSDILSQRYSGVADAHCVEAAREAVAALRNWLEPTSLPELTGRTVRHWSWRLSGLITLADWVGSDGAVFGPSHPEIPLRAYCEAACVNADRALIEKGLVAPAPRMKPGLWTVAPERAADPRPMQAAVASIPLDPGPQLFIIEDTTGSGKTEAALVLAARLMAAELAEGIYVALPSMATANAMFSRLAPLPNRLFDVDRAGTRPSLVLAHGKASLARRLDALRESLPAENGGEEATSVYCSSWIADSRRKALLADIGAGTIDQAFLAVLPKKHLTLRQYALAGRILIVDEAHCFDAYMGEELTALLTTHAMNGGSAIILSATLSAERRETMAAAYREGLGVRAQDTFSEDPLSSLAPYPLITHVHTRGVDERKVPLDERLRRRIEIERLEDRSFAFAAAMTAAKAGAAVLIICNAVDEAITTFEALADSGADHTYIHLFHARFAQCDRQTIEDSILLMFGRDADAAQRAGHILVATQVVEQSLDLDFDLIITDLAPIDLIIQRAGRLWRHMDKRPVESRPIIGPRMLVVSPDPDQATSDRWLAPVLGKATPVYGRGAIMWRSAKVLFDKASIDIPQDCREMIESVYAQGTQDVPECLQAVSNRELGEMGGSKTLGRHNVIDPHAGYGAVPYDLSDDQDIGTRLGEPTVTIRLATRTEGRLVPWANVPDGDPALAWELSEIRIRRSFWGDRAAPPEDRALHEAARQNWPEWENNVVLAEVSENSSLRLETNDMRYTTDLGLGKTA